MAAHGYDVEQDPATLPNGKNPDYVVEGHAFDCYSPRDATSPRNIWTNLKDDKLAAGQADRFVLNLDDWHGNTAALQQQFRKWEMPGLKEVIAVRGGQIVHLYP